MECAALTSAAAGVSCVEYCGERRSTVAGCSAVQGAVQWQGAVQYRAQCSGGAQCSGTTGVYCGGRVSGDSVPLVSAAAGVRMCCTALASAAAMVGHELPCGGNEHYLSTDCMLIALFVSQTLCPIVHLFFLAQRSLNCTKHLQRLTFVPSINPAGECWLGFCRCHDGWYGMDCARKRAGARIEPCRFGRVDAQGQWLKECCTETA